MADLNALEEWIDTLLQHLKPSERTKLTRSVGQQLRRSQQQRIIAQRNPNGSPRMIRASNGS
ncbi:phage virion morphogenesis protein [Pseudomonas sp. Y3 TE3536]